MSQITEEVLKTRRRSVKGRIEKQGKPEKIWDKILPTN